MMYYISPAGNLIFTSRYETRIRILLLTFKNTLKEYRRYILPGHLLEETLAITFVVIQQPPVQGMAGLRSYGIT